MIGGRAIAVSLIVLAAAALAVWVAVAQLTQPSGADKPTDDSVDLVLNKTDSVLGKHISVQGDIKTVLTPAGVLLGGSDAAEIGLLVVPKGKLPSSLKQSQHVNVVGTVRKFSLQEYEHDHQGAAGTPALRNLQGRPAIMDARITPTPVVE
jgi:hypothetical protein